MILHILSVLAEKCNENEKELLSSPFWPLAAACSSTAQKQRPFIP
jgi:hypothetical protein